MATVIAMKNEMKRIAKREARVWAVAAVLLGVWMAVAWIN